MISIDQKRKLAKIEQATKGPIRRKYTALVDSINAYIASYAVAHDMTVAEVVYRIGFDRSKWTNKEVVPATITLEELGKIEKLGHGPLINVTDLWRKKDGAQSGMIIHKGTLGHGLILDNDIPDAMLSELVAANAHWRVMEVKMGGYSELRVVFAIPRAIADKHGFDYADEWWDTTKRWVLTDDGYVVPVRAKGPRGNGYFWIDSAFGTGSRWRKRSWFVTDCCPTVLTMQKPSWYEDFDNETRYEVPGIRAVREDAFVSAYVATGSKEIAVATSDGVTKNKTKERITKILNSPRVIQMVEERTHNAMKAVMDRLGVEGNPEEFVVGTYIEMAKLIMDKAKEDGATLNPKLLNIVQENVDKLADFLAMKSENRTVTTERTLELSEGDRTMVARELERRQEELLPPSRVEVVEAEVVNE